MVIISILSIVSVPIYQRYVERARETELDTIMPAIINAQKFHFLEYCYLADNMLALPIQLEGTQANNDGRIGIKTKNYFYSIGNTSNEDLYATCWIYVYRNSNKKK